jgi:hypothetical protein
MTKNVNEILSKKVKLEKRHFKPGSLLHFAYVAKHDQFTYDKTPLVLILGSSKTYTLGLNFHWLPMPMRISLVKVIMKMNKHNIAKNKPLEFSYTQLKPLLRKFGYAPVIRLYINKNISPKGAHIPVDLLPSAVKISAENFTNGKVSAEQLYKMAIQRAKKHKKTLTSRSRAKL